MADIASALTAAQAAARAIQQLQSITGFKAESVSEVFFRDAHWNIVLEIVETARIPSTTDLLGSYAVKLDDAGQLAEYHRLRRYHRNQSMNVGTI